MLWTSFNLNSPSCSSVSFNNVGWPLCEQFQFQALQTMLDVWQRMIHCGAWYFIMTCVALRHNMSILHCYLRRSDVVRLLVETRQERLHEGINQKSNFFLPEFAFQMHWWGKNLNETNKVIRAFTHPALKPKMPSCGQAYNSKICCSNLPVLSLISHPIIRQINKLCFQIC